MAMAEASEVEEAKPSKRFPYYLERVTYSERRSLS